MIIGDRVRVVKNSLNGVKFGPKEVFEVTDIDGDIIIVSDTHKSLYNVERKNLIKEDEEVNHPDHYNQGKIEVIDVIEDWGLNFNEGNIIKYVARAKHKGNPAKDLSKALWYIQREITRANKDIK